MFNRFVFILLFLLLLAVIYPLYFVVIASFSNPIAINIGQVVLRPVGFSLEGYSRVLSHQDIWLGYRNTSIYTLLGTLVNLALTVPAGYVLTRRDMAGRTLLTLMFTFTMFFSGGLIPTYLQVRSLGLTNTLFVMILLNAMSVYNVMITRSFFLNTLPKDLHEAAVMDGCSDFRFFFQIVLPLSSAIIAVLVIYYAVGHWNDFFTGIIYLRDRDRMPLQVFVREILLQNQFAEHATYEVNMSQDTMLVAESMKYSVIIIASLPVMALYPFLQKYFMKGVMIGSIKG